MRQPEVRDALGFTGVMAVVAIAAGATVASSFPTAAIIPIPNNPVTTVPVVQEPQPLPPPLVLPGNPVPVPSEIPSPVQPPSAPAVGPPALPTAPATGIPEPTNPPPPPVDTPQPTSPPPSENPCAAGLKLDPVLGVCVSI